MNTAGAVVLALVLALLAAGVGWVVYTRVRASRLGLPPPPLKSYIPFVSSGPRYHDPPRPARGGLIGWINDRIRMYKHRNTRTAAGAYESQSYGGAGASTANRGFGPLDPDDAWDSRVGDPYSGPGGYYEEQELGLAPRHGGQGQAQGYGGGDGTYQMNIPAVVEPAAAGRTQGGANDDGEERRGRTRSRSPGPTGGRANPFADDAEPSNISLRGVSPRPEPSFAERMGQAQGNPKRNSVFREDM